MQEQRIEKTVIGDKVYVVIAEQSITAAETPYTILQRIIKQKRICCLNTNNGGIKNVRNTNS